MFRIARSTCGNRFCGVRLLTSAVEASHAQALTNAGLDMIRHGCTAAYYERVLDGDFRAPEKRRRRQSDALGPGVHVEREDAPRAAPALPRPARRESDAGHPEEAGGSPASTTSVLARERDDDMLVDDTFDSDIDNDGPGDEQALPNATPAGGIPTPPPAEGDVTPLLGVPLTPAVQRLEDIGGVDSDVGTEAAGGPPGPAPPLLPPPAVPPRLPPARGRAVVPLTSLWDNYEAFMRACPFEQELRAGSYGVFKLTRKGRGIQAQCPFHKRNAVSGCKKAITLTDDPNAATKNIAMLLTWCCRAPRFNRQRDHIGEWMLPEDAPSAEVLRSLTITERPRPARTDAELDEVDRIRAEHAAASSAAAAGGATRPGTRGGRAGRGIAIGTHVMFRRWKQTSYVNLG